MIGALSVGLATAAHATHGGSASPGRYVTKVLVRPGQSLWSLAETYDPNADPRQTELEIQQLNSMTGDQLQAGQELWVPRG
jgi:LysM repeat protein